MELKNKTATVILGTNGSGKTTFYKSQLKDKLPDNYINADEIKIQLEKEGYSSEIAKGKSNQVAISKIYNLVKEGKPFTFETTFTEKGSMGSIALIKELKKNNYKIEGYYLHTKDVNINIENVNNRYINKKGHFIPESVIKQRYKTCIQNLKENSKLFDKLNYIDNSNKDFKISNEEIIENKIQLKDKIKQFKPKEKNINKSQELER